ncbi:hypothetical protein ScPMuIL_010953 [Solemya velum]
MSNHRLFRSRMYRLTIVSTVTVSMILFYVSCNTRIRVTQQSATCQSNGKEQFQENDTRGTRQEDVRVLCFVTTSPANINKKAVHVKETWGKRCDKLLFMSSENNYSLPAIGLNVSEGRDSLWLKTIESLKYVHKNYRFDADWFIKTDDDTYVIVDNLRYFLKDKDSSNPIYFGRKLKRYVQQGYMSGGAGYVMSREALTRIVEKGFHNKSYCPDVELGLEDVYIGKCMENLGVLAGDSRDEESRERFHPLLPELVLVPGLIRNTSWFWFYNFYKPGAGPEYVSPMSISFHYVGPNLMHVMDFFVYQLKLPGLELHPDGKSILLNQKAGV